MASINDKLMPELVQFILDFLLPTQQTIASFVCTFWRSLIGEKNMDRDDVLVLIYLGEDRVINIDRVIAESEYSFRYILDIIMRIAGRDSTHVDISFDIENLDVWSIIGKRKSYVPAHQSDYYSYGKFLHAAIVCRGKFADSAARYVGFVSLDSGPLAYTCGQGEKLQSVIQDHFEKIPEETTMKIFKEVVSVLLPELTSYQVSHIYGIIEQCGLPQMRDYLEDQIKKNIP